MSRWICTFLLVATGLAALAQPSDMKPMANVPAFESKLKETSANTTTIDCDFVQKKHLSFMEEDMITKGHFSYKKERKIRWEYKDPYYYLVVINGDNIYLKDDDKTSHFDAKANKMFQGINDMMLAIVKGDVLSGNKFKASFFENEKYYFVKLIPQESEMKGYLKSIELYFLKKDMTVDKIKLTELSDDYTFIEYSNKVINKSLPDEIFTVK